MRHLAIPCSTPTVAFQRLTRHKVIPQTIPCSARWTIPNQFHVSQIRHVNCPLVGVENITQDHMIYQHVALFSRQSMPDKCGQVIIRICHQDTDRYNWAVRIECNTREAGQNKLRLACPRKHKINLHSLYGFWTSRWSISMPWMLLGQIMQKRVEQGM